MSAVDVALMQLNGRIPCRDNSSATNISLVSVTNATSQIVDGTILSFNITVTLQGCSQATQANVNTMMISYLNGTFELRNHTYQYIDNPDGSGSYSHEWQHSLPDSHCCHGGPYLWLLLSTQKLEPCKMLSRGRETVYLPC